MAEETTPDELAADELAVKRWGLLGLDVDYQKLVLDVLTEQIAGFYDPKEQKLYISSAWSADLQADMVMAHEIDHALQDQHFGLEAFTSKLDHEGDALMARQALVEGDGVVLMIEYVMAAAGMGPPWGNDDMMEMMEKQMTAPAAQDQLAAAPLFVREGLMFPYASGMHFVAHLRRRAPWKAVDAAFKKPPASTEQIMHPEKYDQGERPDVVTAMVPAALPGWQLVDHDVWGEMGWSIWLRSHGVDTARAMQAAAGWGGDRTAVLIAAGQAVAQVDPLRATGIAYATMDSDVDALELFEAAVDAVDQEVRGVRVDNGGDPLRARWIGVDGRASMVERRGVAVVVVIGAPLPAADRIAAQVWKGWKVKKRR
jgi:hypothetical protein